MKVATFRALAIALPFVPSILICENAKSYKHAPTYQIAILDENLRVHTGSDVTVAKTMTDAKLDAGGQGIHLLHTDSGDYRVESPINKGATILSALATSPYRSATIYHNQWFLDKVKPGTKVLFASQCVRPNKKHPNEAVRCSFFFPDPDSSAHEYTTVGDFTPSMAGDGSNMVKTADTLCGTGKLRPEVESQLCAPQTSIPSTPPVAAVLAPAVAPTPIAIAAPQTAAPATRSVTANVAPVVSLASNDLVMVNIVIESNVKGADIEVDEQFAGNTPSTITVTPGQHTIVVKKDGFAIWSRVLSVAGNGVHLNADLGTKTQPTTPKASRGHTPPVRCYPASACTPAN